MGTSSDKKRSRSQRTRKVTGRARHLEASVIREARQQRLAALENDNHAAEQEAELLQDEEAYDPAACSDDEMAGVSRRGSRTKKRRRSRSTAARVRVERGLERLNKSVALAIAEEGERPYGMVSSEEIAARPSIRPARALCSVCGYKATYTCTRCLVRFCSVQCGNVHNETRCLKFAT